MKINYSNTALHLLEHIDPFAFRICEDAEHSPQEYKSKLGLSIVDQWPKVVDRFKEKIQYISDPFYKAYNKAVSKIADVIDDEEIDESGTFISRATESEVNTIFYDIRTEGKGKDFRVTAIIFFFTKHTNMDKPSLAVCVQRNRHGTKEFLSEVASKNGLSSISVMGDILSLILFMKYCDLETKIIKPESKEMHVGSKYVNETSQRIEVLDSTWFTTIVRSEGFDVRGHFRFQPCGAGRSGKKLIWIDKFTKEGYTRTARMLRDE